MARWQSSGLSGREFAEAHGLEVSALYRWARAARMTAAAEAAVPTFAEVRVRDSAAASSGADAIEIVIGECVVRVRAGVDLSCSSWVLHPAAASGTSAGRRRAATKRTQRSRAPPASRKPDAELAGTGAPRP